MSVSNISEFIQSSTISNVLAEKSKSPDLICVQPSDTLEDTLNLMKEHDIVSVVVQEKGNFVTMVDVMDIIDHVIFIPYVRYIRESNGCFGKLHFSGETIQTLLKNRKSEKPCFTVSPDTSLAHVIQYFNTFGKYHRGLVVSPDHPPQVFSQTDILKYLFNNMNHLGELPNRKLDELNLANPFGNIPRHVSADEPTFQAFLQLSLEGIIALAVVDNNGKLVGNLSASDLRGLTPERLPELKKSVLEYCKANECFVPVTVTPKTSFGEVLMKMIRTTPHIHRVWVVNPSQEPIGVVTMSDILSLFSSVVPAS